MINAIYQRFNQEAAKADVLPMLTAGGIRKAIDMYVEGTFTLEVSLWHCAISSGHKKSRQ